MQMRYWFYTQMAALGLLLSANMSATHPKYGVWFNENPKEGESGEYIVLNTRFLTCAAVTLSPRPDAPRTFDGQNQELPPQILIKSYWWSGNRLLPSHALVHESVIRGINNLGEASLQASMTFAFDWANMSGHYRIYCYVWDPQVKAYLMVNAAKYIKIDYSAVERKCPPEHADYGVLKMNQG